MIFLLKRLLGLAQIGDGVVMFFTGKTAGLNLRVAKRIARIRGARMMEEMHQTSVAGVERILASFNKKGNR